MADGKNKKSNTLLIGVAVFLVLVFIIMVAYNHFKKKPVDEFVPPPPGPGSGPTPPTTNDNFPLKEGSEGSNVKYLQQAINRIVTNPALKVTVDGVFGHKTYLSLVTGVGTTTWWASKISTYPVTSKAFIEILNKSNASRVIMNGRIYEFTNN